MRALQVQHNVRRFGAARLLSVTSPKASARIAPVHLRNVDDPPEPAGVGWSKVTTRLAGICGSDLALGDRTMDMVAVERGGRGEITKKL